MAVGVIGKVQVRVTAEDTVAGTVTVRLIDNNGAFVGSGSVTIPQSLLEVTTYSVAVGDCLEAVDPPEKIPEGTTFVVRWIDPSDASVWSPSASGSPAWSTSGFVDRGDAVIT